MPPVRSGSGTADNPWPVSSSPPRAPGAQNRAPSASSLSQPTVPSTRRMRKIKIFDSPPPQPLRINKGPPSTIPRSLARRQGSSSSTPDDFSASICIPVLPPVPNDAELHAQAIARQRQRRQADLERRVLERRQADRDRIRVATAEYETARLALAALGANAPRAPVARPRIRPNYAGTPLDPLGWRAPREERLTRNDLLLNGVAPTTMETNRSHQRCGICLHVKSHPVSYTCGHSHCYCCIRLWLEERWVCPTCVTVMNMAPHRNYEEEAGIASDFPDWVDDSEVDYSWNGLNFPKRRMIIAPDSDDEAVVTSRAVPE
ncbi:hypothetical protein B0H11DRAFT_2253026 [Mycena galericulata]|nr:hypothetical protein B0H11DRAFT_2253026 [Mycena galericulata]